MSEQTVGVLRRRIQPALPLRNTGKCLDDSQAMADYLYKEYGPEGQTAPTVRIVTSVLATDYVPHTANRRKLQELGGEMQVP